GPRTAAASSTSGSRVVPRGSRAVSGAAQSGDAGGWAGTRHDSTSMLRLSASTHAGNSSVAQSVMGGAKSSTRPVAYPATTNHAGAATEVGDHQGEDRCHPDAEGPEQGADDRGGQTCVGARHRLRPPGQVEEGAGHGGSGEEHRHEQQPGAEERRGEEPVFEVT